MGKFKGLVAAIMLVALALASGCSYAGVAAVDKDTVVITKNDSFLFGALRSVYVCQVTDAGVTNCGNKEAP
jgi:hypothetical protein